MLCEMCCVVLCCVRCVVLCCVRCVVLNFCMNGCITIHEAMLELKLQSLALFIFSEHYFKCNVKVF